jgi:FAD/FMN-containing dehydrogenase
MDELLKGLTEIVGARSITIGSAVGNREFPWDTHSRCLAKAIVYPESTDQVSAVMRLCRRNKQTVVPFGGTTNLVRGCETTSNDIVLSLDEMNRIETIDTSERTLVAEAGVSLELAQEAARQANLFFPIDIGARSNCQLGGIVSTNAGGTKVIRYGMTRDSVLGMEVVLADGTVMSSMNHYIKNNSGFDLKHLFVGSEGVLGIITRVVFRLRSRSMSHNVALLACDNFSDVTDVLAIAHATLDSSFTAFEVMWENFYALAVEPRGRLAAPLAPGASFYLLIESMGIDEQHDRAVFENLLENLMEKELLSDGVVAKSDKECELFWEIRDEVEPVLNSAYTFDVSLRSADAGDYVVQTERSLQQHFADAEVIAFGHLGDNNVHLSIKLGEMNARNRRIVDDVVYEELAAFDGAISAEHGIGLEKRDYLAVTRSNTEIELMRSLKRTLDPDNILNPGKVLIDR